MRLLGEANVGPVTPYFRIYGTEVDYYIDGSDGIDYDRGIKNGFPHITIRWAFWGGNFGFAASADKFSSGIYRALLVFQRENIRIHCKKIDEILGLMPEKVLIRDEHECGENTVIFSNRSVDGGIGVTIYQPFCYQGDYFRHIEENEPINEDLIQEAHLLIVPQNSDYQKRETESIVYATSQQMQAILNFSLEMEKVIRQ